MVRSMFAGVAGLRTHQAKMDVIGNNIANVNTWGFKSGSMSFKDTMYQNTSSGSKGSTAAGSFGGSNANQVGYGVTTGSISYDFSMGSPSPSSRSLDCMIDGSGFFIVGPMVNGETLPLEGETTIGESGLYLSRVGKFDVDNQGYLVDDAGNYVYGFTVNDDGTFNTAALSPLRLPTNSQMDDLKNSNLNDKITAAQKVLDEALAALNTLNASLGVARQEYMVAAGAYQAGRDASVTDTVLQTEYGTGTGYSVSGLDAWLKDDVKKAMDDAYKAWVDDPTTVNKTAYDDAKLYYDEMNYRVIQEKAKLNAPAAVAKYGLTPWTEYKDAYDDYVAADPADTNYADLKKTLEEKKAALEAAETDLLKVEPNSLQGQNDSKKLEVDKAKAKVELAETSVSNAEKALEAARTAAGNKTESNSQASGEDPAKMTNYKIQKDGTVVGTSEDGSSTVVIGKIALAGVQNTSGLEKTTGYYYIPGANAGNIGVYEPGGAQGEIMGNYLEMAKVDLATEMTDMITTQRGFQANSKIITVTDQMLEELVNIKR